MPPLDELVERGRIESVRRDVDAARVELEHARAIIEAVAVDLE